MMLDRTASVHDVVRAIDDVGCAIVEGLANAATMDRLNADFDPHVEAVMPRGSALIHTSNFIHGSGENRSNGVRRAMALHYNLGWLRQEENQYLSLPPEAARVLPETLQRLIGYDLGGPYLGFVEDGNPHVLLEDGAGRDMARSTPESDELAKRIKPISMASD